jgi:hypothetical protein
MANPNIDGYLVAMPSRTTRTVVYNTLYLFSQGRAKAVSKSEKSTSIVLEHKRTTSNQVNPSHAGDVS